MLLPRPPKGGRAAIFGLSPDDEGEVPAFRVLAGLRERARPLPSRDCKVRDACRRGRTRGGGPLAPRCSPSAKLRVVMTGGAAPIAPVAHLGCAARARRGRAGTAGGLGASRACAEGSPLRGLAEIPRGGPWRRALEGEARLLELFTGAPCAQGEGTRAGGRGGRGSPRSCPVDIVERGAWETARASSMPGGGRPAAASARPAGGSKASMLRSAKRSPMRTARRASSCHDGSMAGEAGLQELNTYSTKPLLEEVGGHMAHAGKCIYGCQDDAPNISKKQIL